MIAGGTNFENLLGVSGSFPFVPDLLLATRMVDGPAYLKRLFQGLLVPPGRDEGLHGLGVNRHGGNKAFGIELWAKLVSFVDWGAILCGKGDRFRHARVGYGFEAGGGV